jgi:hypothetical protein
MNWIRVSDQLPELNDDDYYAESNPVLVYDGYQIRVAYLKRYDDTLQWISNCSEGWNITDLVSHWQPSPEIPD